MFWCFLFANDQLETGLAVLSHAMTRLLTLRWHDTNADKLAYNHLLSQTQPPLNLVFLNTGPVVLCSGSELELMPMVPSGRADVVG